MHLLFADRLPEQTIEDLEARGHVCVVEPDLSADDLPGADRRVRRAGGAQHQGEARGVRGRGPAGAGDPGRSGHQHHRHRRRRHAAASSSPTSPAATRPRSPSSPWGCCWRSTGGSPTTSPTCATAAGTRAVQQGGRAARLDHGHHRPRLDRPRGRRAGGGVRHPGPVAGQARPPGVRRGAGRGAGHHDVRLVRRAAVVLRHREPPRPVERGHPAPGRRELPRADAARRDPAQHLARRRGRRAEPCSRPWTRAGARRSRRVRRRAGLQQGLVGLAPRRGTPASSPPTTSAPRPSRPSAPSPPGVAEIVDAFMAGEARHCVNLEPDRLGSCTLTIRHLDRVGVLAQVLDRLSGASSTSSTWRTASSAAARRRSRPSTWPARPPRSCSPTSATSPTCWACPR